LTKQVSTVAKLKKDGQHSNNQQQNSLKNNLCKKVAVRMVSEISIRIKARKLRLTQKKFNTNRFLVNLIKTSEILKKLKNQRNPKLPGVTLVKPNLKVNQKVASEILAKLKNNSRMPSLKVTREALEILGNLKNNLMKPNLKVTREASEILTKLRERLTRALEPLISRLKLRQKLKKLNKRLALLMNPKNLKAAVMKVLVTLVNKKIRSRRDQA
jgi:hypothetical protein